MDTTTQVPTSTISVIGNHVGFQFHAREKLNIQPQASSRDSQVRLKHLSHLDALQQDGIEWLPSDASAILRGNHATPHLYRPPKMDWKERIFATATASTLRIAGITKKLKNKIILLRDAIIPHCINPPPRPVYRTAGDNGPTPFATLPPLIKHEVFTQRVIRVSDLWAPYTPEDDSENPFSDSAQVPEVRGLTSPISRRYQPLSTLPEEEDEVYFDPEPDVYVEAFVMPMETLQDLPVISRAFGSPSRSRVSPPWMSKPLDHIDSGATLVQPPGPRVDSFRSSGYDESQRGSGLNQRGSDVLHRSLSFSGQSGTDDERQAISTAPQRPIPPRPRQPPSRSPSFLSSTFSMTNEPNRLSVFSVSSVRPPGSISDTTSYGTNARRSSILMLPTNERRRVSSVSSAGKGEKWAASGYNGNDQTKLVEAFEGDDDDDDDEDEDGEEEAYYVFEANIADPEIQETGARQQSMLILMPIPSELHNEADAEDYFKSRWSSTLDENEIPLFSPSSSMASIPPPPPPKTDPIAFPKASTRSALPPSDTPVSSYRTATSVPRPSPRPQTLNPPERSPPKPPSTVPAKPSNPLSRRIIDRPITPVEATPLQTTVPLELMTPKAVRPPVLEWSAVPAPAPSPRFAPAVLSVPPPRSKVDSISSRRNEHIGIGVPGVPNTIGTSVGGRKTSAPGSAPKPSEDVPFPSSSRRSSRAGERPPSRIRRVNSNGSLVRDGERAKTPGGGQLGLINPSRLRSTSTSTFGKETSPTLKAAIEITDVNFNDGSASRPQSRTRSRAGSKSTPRPKPVPPPLRVPTSRRGDNRDADYTSYAESTPRGTPMTRPKMKLNPTIPAISVERPRSRSSKTKAVDEFGEVIVPQPRMAKQNEEFLRSSGKAFRGQTYSAIEVLDVDTGQREVFVGSKKARRRASDTSQSTSSSPSVNALSLSNTRHPPNPYK
ncbi:hypothetical protein FRB99_000886 [Tulasnella sp. 403]|nr:hypothetical protein FRB99_000886 [Tulasnella sp. 403]